jgi:hypothetical protein
LEAGATSQPVGPESMRPMPAEPQQPPPSMSTWQKQNFGYTEPRTEFSHKAVWALVLSLIGLVLGIIFPIAAMVVGASGVRDTHDNPRLNGEAMAIIGIALGAVGFVLHIVAASV